MTCVDAADSLNITSCLSANNVSLTLNKKQSIYLERSKRKLTAAPTTRTLHRQKRKVDAVGIEPTTFHRYAEHAKRTEIIVRGNLKRGI
jgi:hypothetical protein